MAETITLAEGIQRGSIKNEDYVKYNPECKQCNLLREETGYNFSQEITTEELQWIFMNVNGKNILMSDMPTKFKVGLQGRIGYKKGEKALNKSCKEGYSSESLGLKAQNITYEIFMALPEKIKCKFKDKPFWLVHNCEYKCNPQHGNWNSGIATRVVGLPGMYTSDVLFYSGKYDTCREYAILPIIYLPDDIKINLETMEFVIPD